MRDGLAEEKEAYMTPRTDRTGQVFGAYELTEFLGQGGFAEVYRGVHKHISQKQAAIKILIKQLVLTKSIQFEQEAQIIAQLNHPNIVSLHDYNFYSTSQTTTLVPYIVMDYIPRGSLRANYPRRTQVAAPLVATYIQQVAGALQYAHDRGIMHLDVKPENILMGELGQLLLSDFGLARLFSEKDVLTNIQGTLAYMAPEQFDVNPGPSFASDQYALAIVAYEWLSGSVPFKGATVEDVMYHHQHTLPPSLTAQVPNLPFAAEVAIMRALKKNPADRFPQVSDFARELDRAINQRAEPNPTSSPGGGTIPASSLGAGPNPVSSPGRGPVPASGQSVQNEPFFRTANVTPGPTFSPGGPIPGGPNSMTVAQPGPLPFSRQFAPPITPPPIYSQQSISKPENMVTTFIQEFVQPERKMILRRKRARLYEGLGVHVLGAIFIGIWFASVAKIPGNEAAWWVFLISLVSSAGLFALFFVSLNRPLRLAASIFLSFYWAIAGSAFATVLGAGTRIGFLPDPTVSFVLALLISSGVFLWLLFKKK